MGQMNPGPDLDALVHENLMGGKRSEIWYVNNLFLPRYSTAIAAAWEVVEKIVSMGGFYCIEKHSLADHPTCWMMIPGKNIQEGIVRVEHTDSVSATAPTAPHAICLAALKAISTKAVPTEQDWVKHIQEVRHE